MKTASKRFAAWLLTLVLAMALGMCLSKLLALTGITFPTYFGSLIVAAIIRNCFGPKYEKRLALKKIVSVGNICLSLFLGMAMATLKLWELAGLVLPLVVILLAQAAFIVCLGLGVAGIVLMMFLAIMDMQSTL